MILFGMIVMAFAFFFYFQKRTSDRNMEKFQRSREKYEELLEQLRKRDEDEKEQTTNNS